jgi:hypothetical protein
MTNCATLGYRMASPEQASMARAPRVGYPLALLFAINLLNFYDRSVLGALAEPVRKEFHLTDTQLGFLPTMFTVI